MKKLNEAMKEVLKKVLLYKNKTPRLPLRAEIN